MPILALALSIGSGSDVLAEAPSAAGTPESSEEQAPTEARANATDAGTALTGGAGEDTLIIIPCRENSPWCKSFYFGLQFLPDYDDEGESLQGLGEQSFFAHFNFDLLRVHEREDHVGFDLRLHRSGAVEEGEPGGMAPDDSSVVPSRFNSVAGTIDFSGYYRFGRISSRQELPRLLPSEEFSGSKHGLKLVAGARSREGALRNEDTLSWYAAAGLHYAYFDVLPVVERGEGDTITGIKNRVPTGEFDVGFAFFEEWGGEQNPVNVDRARLVFRGVYNLGSIYFVGIYANGGPGPDEVSVFFGAKKSITQLLDFFGL